MHYAIYDGQDYFHTAYNATNLKEVKTDLLELLTGSECVSSINKLKKLTTQEICAHMGWNLHEQDAPFYEGDDEDSFGW